MKDVSAECIFPDFLQSPLDKKGDPLPWNTEMWWINLRNDPKLRRKQEIYVQRSQIWSQQHLSHRSCSRRQSRRVHHRATSSGNCSERYLLYNRTCLVEEEYNKFRVIQYRTSRSPEFICLKFVRRSDNIIQVFAGDPMEINAQNLCDERNLHPQEWPWIAPRRKEISGCPISGGFSFRTISRLTNEDFCEDEWRKSRLEIECVKGDGLNFIAPKGSSCNPFTMRGEVKQLFCWAGWDYKHFKFLVVADESGIPQFCLRFPRDLTKHFTVMVYFSVICPTQPSGKPLPGIEYYEMRMSTLDAYNCEDDDVERCQHIAKKGACAKGNKYALHCQMSCGNCYDRESLTKVICQFEPKLHGSWMFIDTYRKEYVQINHTVVHFSDSGPFFCKDRNIDAEGLYKTVTIFDNGCSMRYTCLEMRRRNNNLLQYRAGKNSREDTGFHELCDFDEQQYTGGSYKHVEMKNLILDGYLWDAFCGLGGEIPFNGTIYGEPCAGTVSDWDDTECVHRGRLEIKSETCGNLLDPMEHQCVALLEDLPLEHFLLTRSKRDGNFNCWILTTLLCQNSELKYSRALYKLDSPQCPHFANTACAVEESPTVLLYLTDVKKSKFCRPEDIPALTDTSGSDDPNIPQGQGSTYEENSDSFFYTVVQTDNNIDGKDKPSSNSNINLPYLTVNLISLAVLLMFISEYILVR